MVRETGFAIHRYHKNGHLEKVYENALTHRLRKLGLEVKQQHLYISFWVSCAFSRHIPLRLLRSGQRFTVSRAAAHAGSSFLIGPNGTARVPVAVHSRVITAPRWQFNIDLTAVRPHFLTMVLRFCRRIET